MRLAKEALSQKMLEVIAQEFAFSAQASNFKIEFPPDPTMGHLAFACFPLARNLRKAPPQIAKQLASRLLPDAIFARIEAVGPYVNFFFRPDWLAKGLLEAAKQDSFGASEEGKGKRILLEYSSPNTNKPLHLGHGRNNLLGITLARLFVEQGYEVIKANLINDRGIHICKSMLAYQKWGQEQTPEQAGKKGDQLVGDYYVLYDKKLKADPSLEEEARKLLQAWEEGNPQTLALWKKLNQWVYEGFRSTYQRMGVEFDRYYYESETYQGGRKLILEALEKGICQREDNGAVSIDLETDHLGKKILLRGDGTSMYITQDINTTYLKFKDYSPLDACLFVVGNEQDNHFKVLFKVLEHFGFAWANRLEHISYGMITLPEGKMKSREGTVVDLDDLMEEMKNLALLEIDKRGNFNQAPTEIKEATAEAIGQGAIKFFILRSGAAKEIQFNPKESLSFEGQTGPYLQYTHARLSSLLTKAEAKDRQRAQSFTQATSKERIEVQLLLQLAHYADILQLAAKERNPAVLTGWTYELCKLYNKFYYDLPILKAEQEVKLFRLSLTLAVRSVLAKSLRILGIQPLEKM